MSSLMDKGVTHGALKSGCAPNFSLNLLGDSTLALQAAVCLKSVKGLRLSSLHWSALQ